MFYKKFAMTAMAAVVSCTVQATVIDFESTGTPGGTNELNYAIDGFFFNTTMDNMDVRTLVVYPPSPVTLTAHSGHFAALNNWGRDGTVVFGLQGGTFTFNSLWMHDVLGESQRQVTVEGWLGSQQVASVSTALAGAAWTHIVGSAGFATVDKVVLRGSDSLLRGNDFFLRGGDYFLVDDIDVQAHVTNVPEPQTYALLLAGLGLVGARARKRRAAQ